MCLATSACCVVCVGSWRTYAPAVVAAVAMSTAALSERDTSTHPGRNHRIIRASRADGTARRHPAAAMAAVFAPTSTASRSLSTSQAPGTRRRRPPTRGVADVEPHDPSASWKLSAPRGAVTSTGAVGGVHWLSTSWDSEYFARLRVLWRFWNGFRSVLGCPRLLRASHRRDATTSPQVRFTVVRRSLPFRSGGVSLAWSIARVASRR